MIFYLFTFIFFKFHLYAASIEETFTQLSLIESSTAVVNQELGSVHPTLQVMNFKGGFTPLEFNIGSGQHGPFNSSTYARFSMNQDVTGNIVRLDTSVYPTLDVTSFHLEAGWVLEPIGNNPLIIQSLTDVIIEGEIWCQGENGTNAVNNVSGLGGSGRCGGTSGGSGGLPTFDGTSGIDISTNVTGGVLGNFTGGAAVGGGGGGAWNTSSNAGSGANVNGGGGTAGLSLADPEFLNLLGSAGGGGGSSTPTQAGAGGGGGGGLVIINAMRNFQLGSPPASITGFIKAHGGNGGSSNVPGGPGGGGGGGSVRVFVGGAIEIFNTAGSGASLVNGGVGGTNSLAVAQANGGIGRNWFSSVTYNITGTGFYTPAEQAPINPGNVEFNSVTQNVISKSMDLLNTKTQILSVTTVPVSNDFQIELSGSIDNFVSDNSGWTTDLNLLKNKRYLKMRILITTSDVNTPTLLESVFINYAQGSQNAFEFEATGCGRINTNRNPFVPLIFLLLPLFFILFLNKRKYLI